MKALVSESAIYGVLLVAGLVFIAGEAAEEYWDVFVKVCATLAVFWVAHVYAGAVAHLGDEPAGGAVLRVRNAVADAAQHSWGMLLAAVPPMIVLLLGRVRFMDPQIAVWASLWACVALLGLLGYAKVAIWTTRTSARVAGGVATAALGLVLVVLKTWVH